MEPVVGQGAATATLETPPILSLGAIQAAEAIQPESVPEALPVALDLTKPVKIGEEVLSPDQLAALIQKGKIVQQWEEERPGYNLDSLYADYTRKSQELAEYKRQKPSTTEVPTAVPDVKLQPEEEAILKKAVSPIVESALQGERDRQALQFFKDKHPEYKDEKRWNAFASHFNSMYKLPTSIEEQLYVMEKAYQVLNFDAEVEKKAYETKGQALAEASKLSMASSGGGGNKTPPNPTENYTPEQLKYLKEWGLVK